MDKKNTENKRKGKFFSSKKFKYGALATAFTALFIVAVIMLNVIVSAVDSKFPLYVDLTEDQIFSISDSTVELIRGQLDTFQEEIGEEVKLKITFLRPRDQLAANETYNWVINLAESYANTFPEIEVEYREDLYTHPENYADYTRYGESITYSSIIMTSNLSQAAYKVFTFDSCLVYDEDGANLWAFKGEMRFNAVILELTSRQSPVVTFTTGHGESTPENLTEVFYNCGFRVEYVDLLTEEISDDTKILVIYNPQEDIKTQEDDSRKSEYTKISDYLNAYRSMIVAIAPSTSPNSFPVLDELLADWGIEVERNQMVLDDTYSVPGDNRMLYVDYTESEHIAAALTGSLTEMSSPPRSISYISAPIRILEKGDGDLFSVEPVLVSSVNSYVEVVGENGTIEKQSGSYPVMAVSSRFTIENNQNLYGHVLVIGSEYFTETNTYREQYGNTSIIYSAIRLLTNENVAVDIQYKVLEDYTLTMETGTIYTFAVFAVGVIPVAIFALGIVVYIKRKHL